MAVDPEQQIANETHSPPGRGAAAQETCRAEAAVVVGMELQVGFDLGDDVVVAIGTG